MQRLILWNKGKSQAAQSTSVNEKKNESSVLKRIRKDFLIVYVNRKCLNSKYNEIHTEVREL